MRALMMTKVRPPTPIPQYLCFTANTAGSTVQLYKTGSPTAVTLETSTDGENRTTYTFGTQITLSNVGDKVYWRNTSETDTGFSIDDSNRYNFVMSGSINGSGDVTTLLNKVGGVTTLIGNYCFTRLFQSATALKTAPDLPATTLTEYCYQYMFDSCTGLTNSPKLPAKILPLRCYKQMFYGCTKLTEISELPATTFGVGACYYMYRGCSKIKLSGTYNATYYPNSYRLPTGLNGTDGGNALYYMFYQTGGTFTGTPTINTTYYTSNTVV